MTKDQYKELLKYIDSLNLSSEELYALEADVGDLAKIELEIEERNQEVFEETPSEEVNRENMEYVLSINNQTVWS